MAKLKAPKKTFAERRIGQKRETKSRVDYSGEYINGVSLRRDDVVHSGHYTAHWELRMNINPAGSPNEHMKGLPGDECGFRTNQREWISRVEAADLGRRTGQVLSSCRELLSCDVAFWPHPTEILQ